MLTGDELLGAVKNLADASKSDLVRATGYLTTLKDGSERLNFTAFYEALLEAKGLDLSTRNGSRRGGQRRLTYLTTVQFNGNLMVGKAYTNLLGLRPGDEFDIKLGKHHIRLVPLGDPEADS